MIFKIYTNRPKYYLNNSRFGTLNPIYYHYSDMFYCLIKTVITQQKT